MGVNMAGNCIIDDDSCREAANQEIIRRYYHCLCELKRGNSSKDILYKLQLLMKQAGLTIDDLAERSGVPKGTLNKIINGYTRDPQIETVKSIARALDCTLEDFDDSPRVRTLSTDEYDLIQQYRLLDSAGQEVVRFLLTKELERLQNLGVIPTP